MTAALPHVLGRSEDTAGDLRCFLGSPQVLATQPLLLHSLVSVPATRPCPVHSHHVPPRPPFCCLPCLQPSALPECQSHVARAPGPASQGPALLAQRVPSPAHLPVPHLCPDSTPIRTTKATAACWEHLHLPPLPWSSYTGSRPRRR